MTQSAKAPAVAPPTASLVISAVLLLLVVLPVPDGWARSALESVRSPEMNRADREANAGGYYEGLISGAGGQEGARGELALRLLGKPTHWIRFPESGVTVNLPGDFLLFELRPSQNLTLFGKPFTTNSHGMRDREYTVEKPPGVFRIVLLGSSMDMGWGVGTAQTYENVLEDWLNAHAAKRGLARRFEVLNFAVAAYGPVQRLESYRRKATAFQPDLVIYSATRLDLRLLEIHLCELLRDHTDLRYDFVWRAVAEAKLGDSDLRLGANHELVRKETIKEKLRPQYWPIIDATLATLASDCRSVGTPLVGVLIPRVGLADAPAERAEDVAHIKSILDRHGVEVLDLSATFDHKDPSTIEIAAWDDHPNALGHKLLFRALARSLVSDPALYQTVFGVELESPEAPQRASAQ
jgi:hypothetical protein